MKSAADRNAETRARRRAIGMRSMETVLYEREIATLDRIKQQLGLASRSDAIRLLMTKVDPDMLTPADAAVLKESAR